MGAYVQSMYQRLHVDAHLKHNGRLQLGLFLKVIRLRAGSRRLHGFTHALCCLGSAVHMPSRSSCDNAPCACRREDTHAITALHAIALKDTFRAENVSSCQTFRVLLGRLENKVPDAFGRQTLDRMVPLTGQGRRLAVSEHSPDLTLSLLACRA